MDVFFNPSGIALVGASANPAKGGNAILINLKKGYKGHIYPVNPGYSDIEGTTCYASVTEIPDPVDLAIVFVPARLVPEVVRQCAERGIRRVIIESGGFAETGKAGAAIQAEVAGIARKSGIRLWGPNCMGFVDAVRRHVFSFVTPNLWETGFPAGKVSLVVQSGMLSGGFLVDIFSHGIMGISKVCSIGNKMDVDECDLLEYLIRDAHTDVIGFYLEGFKDGRRFMETCRQSPKPIVVLKGGRSVAGAAAAMSHTASMAGNGAVVSGALAQAGVVEAHDFKQMMDICRTLGFYPPQKVKGQARVAVLTFSGGAGIVSADFFEESGIRLAALSPGAHEAMKTVFPDWMPVANPVDLWPAVEKNGVDRSYGTALQAVCGDPGVDAVLVHVFVGGFNLQPDMKTLAAIARDAGKPMFLWMLGRREQAHQFQIHTQSLGVPVFGELYRAVTCMRKMFEAKKGMRTGVSNTAVPESTCFPEGLAERISDAKGVLDEHAAKKIIGICRVPVTEEKIAATQSDALDIAGQLGFPVVMKALVPGELHKSEKGRVRLNLADTHGVDSAFRELTAAMPQNGRILVQRQVAGDLEMIVGLTRDPQFGTCVMVGFGGVMAEVLDDGMFGVAPLSLEDAVGMIGRLKHQRLLDGFRGTDAVDRSALAGILVRLAALGSAFPQIEEIDINPLVISGGSPVAVDAAIVVADSDASRQETAEPPCPRGCGRPGDFKPA